MEYPFFHSIDQAHLLHVHLPPHKRQLLDSLLFEIQMRWEGAPQAQIITDSVSPPLHWTSLSEENESFQRGEALIAQGKVAVLLFAGGLGSRLGSEDPKGCFLLSEKSLFEILFEKIRRMELRHHITIPLLLGLSSFTREKTIAFLTKHHFFGKDPASITYLVQKDYPYFDLQGKILFSPEELIPMAPSGNGGFYDALKTERMTPLLLDQGISFIHLLSIDNPLDDPLDPYLLGAIETQGAEAGLLAVPRENPGEKMGLIVERCGRIHVMDYMEISPFLFEEVSKPNTSYVLGNMGHYCLRTDFLDRLIQNNISLPFHFVNKEISFNGTRRSVLKGEKFAMDLLQFAEKTSIILYPREGHFAPLKQLKGQGGIEEVTQALKQGK